MRKLHLVSCILILSLYGLSVQAQRLVTLDEAVAAALAGNYNIQLARTDSTAAGVDEDLAYAAFLPTLNGTATNVWNNNNQKQELADGTHRQQNNIKSSSLNASVSLNWTIFDGWGMFATRQKVKELLVLGELNLKNQVINTVADVINNYYGIVRQKQQLKAIQEQMSINEERVKLAEKKLSVGLGSKPELLQARVDLNAQKAASLEQRTLIDQLKETLNQLTAMTLPAGFEVSDSIPIDLGLNLGTLQEGLEDANAELLIAQKNISVAALTLKERKAERWPVIAFTSAYNFSKTDNKAVVNPYQPLFSQNKGFNYGFTATVPLFNNFLARRNIKLAQLDIRYQQLSFDNLHTQVKVELLNSYKDYEYQKQALTLEEQNIELAKENVSIALERFRLGVSTNLELREAQRSLEEAYDRLIAARYNTKLAETTLLRLKGALVR